MNIKYQEKKTRVKATLKYLVILLLVLLITIFQDFIHSQANDYAFYASESFLFNIFWILILPVAYFLNGLFQRVETQERLPSLFVKRLLFVFLATLIHLLLFAGLVHLISALFYEFTFTFTRNLRYTISEDLYKYFLIYSLISLLVIKKKRTAEPQVTYGQQLIVSSGRTKLVIMISDILYISTSSPYIEIHAERKKYLHSATLKTMLEQLDPTQFIQIHKSTIVNLGKVNSYKSRLNGDYDLVLDDKTELRLSRNYVENFREKFSSVPSS